MKESCREVLRRGVVEKCVKECCGGVLFLRGSVVKECCGEVL